MKTGLITSDTYQNHNTGAGHPEKIDRVTVVIDNFKKLDNKNLVWKKPTKFDKSLLKITHNSDYINFVEKSFPEQGLSFLDGDTIISPGSKDATLDAVGSIIAAIDGVQNKEFRNAFCAVRPPGHHAEKQRAMGFCVYNNIAVGAYYLLEKYNLSKVAIIDFDVHHGNGTQDIFYEDDSVFFFSTHQSHWYPGTGNREEKGTGPGLGYNLNYPFPAGSGKKEILDYAFASELPKYMALFKPELIIISAGFDSRINDPLGQFQLEDQDFFELTKIIIDLAKEYANGKVISVLEGGYNLNGLASSSIAHLRALIGENR